LEAGVKKVVSANEGENSSGSDDPLDYLLSVRKVFIAHANALEETLTPDVEGKKEE